jgi:hypothetical protein
VVPENPDAPYWTYSEFNELKLDESTVRPAADYKARLANWHINGGLTDE